MSNPQEFASDNGDANGNRPAERKPSSSGQTRWGRFDEMAGVVLFMASGIACVLGWFQGRMYWLLVPFFFAGAIVLYQRAARQALKKANTEKQEQGKLKYQVTKTRLLTLKSVGVPQDVRRALFRLRDQPPGPADEFLGKVAQDLSWERINQWREEILTYTKIDNTSAAISPVNRQ